MSNLLIKPAPDPSFFSTLEEAQSCYNLEETLQKISDLSTEQKVALFIGRQAFEELPEEDPNTTWVSGDIQLFTRLFSKDRLHVCMDFDNEAECNRLQGLFDLVVIDQQTVKDLSGDFIGRFAPFLRHSPSSQMIFEVCPYTAAFAPNCQSPLNQFSCLLMPLNLAAQEFEENDAIFTDYLKPFDGNPNRLRGEDHPDFQAFLSHLADQDDSIEYYEEREWHNSFKGFMIERLREQQNRPSSVKVALDNAKQETEERIKELFESVKCVTGQPYPYPTNYRSSNNPHFIATSPK